MKWLDHVWPAIRALPWLSTIQALAPVWVAYIATRALRTWKLQQQAERKAKTLDELIEAVYQYLDAMVKSVIIVDFAKIGMESHIPPGTTDEAAGAVAFIKRAGQGEAVKLFEALKACEPSKQRIESLSREGSGPGLQGLHTVSARNRADYP